MCTFGAPKKVGKGVGVPSCLGQKGCRCIGHDKPFIPMGMKCFEHHHNYFLNFDYTSIQFFNWIFKN